MATSTTIIDGVLEDALANPIANEYIYFKLKQAGADNDVVPTTVYARGFIEGITNASGEVKASDGTSDLVLWVNGESDIQSVYEITTKGGKIEPTQVIIPVSATGSSIAIGELLINHVASGSSTQQSTVLGDANAYTDALANDPSSNGSFSDANWRADLNVEDGATADQTGAEIKALYEAEADTNAFTDAEKTKLTGIESNATSDQTGAEIKSLYEAEADTNAFTDAEQSKLSGIESNATADQTGAEIKTLYEGEANTNAFTDTEKTKLSGIESNATADQTGSEIKSLYEAEADTNAFTDTEKTKLASLQIENASSSRSSIAFPTVSDYLSIADNTAIDLGVSDFSISFWARLGGTGVEPVLYKQSTAGYEVYFSSGNLFLTLKDSGGQSDFQVASSLNDDTWKCYIITVDRSGNAIAYVNGVAQAPVDVSSRPLSLDNAVDLYIGSDGINAANDLALSDYVVIHKSILSASTVNSFYYSPELSSTTSSPTLAVDLRRPTDEVEDVSSSSLPIVKNGSIKFGNFRNKPFTAADKTRLDGIINGSGGGQLGTGASSTAGGAIGLSASTTTGGAVGLNPSSTEGGAVGDSASTTSGGAVGFVAQSNTGFAGGYFANASGAAAVQLGQGTNSTDNTIQFRSSGSVTEAEFGRIPQIASSVVRVSQASDLSGTLDSTKVYFIDGIIDMGTQTIEVPAGGLSIIGSTFDVSQLTSSENTYDMFTSPVGGSGNLVLKDVGITTSGTGSSVFALTDATGLNAIEIKVVNFNSCTSLGYLDGYRQGLESGTGRFGGTPELEFRNTWIGGYRTETTIARGMSNFTSLFKAGTGFNYSGRVILGMNCDLPATGAFCDFSASNINNDESLQLSDCRMTRSGTLDASDTTIYPNIDHTNVKCLWSDNAGLPNTTKYIKANISTEVTTTVSASSTYYPLAGTFTVETSSHLDMPSNGEFRLLSGNGTYQLFGDFVIDGTANDNVKVKVTLSSDGGATFPTDITTITRTINNSVGGNDVGFFPINFIATIQEDDRLRIEVSNETGTGNLTAKLDSYFIITAL